mgnify:CR=1 FL=1
MSNLKSGLSGCKLELLDNLSLRKYSSSMEYNSRLSSQIEKQKLFSNFILKNIDTPKIYNSNFESLYYFDMEYISLDFLLKNIFLLPVLTILILLFILYLNILIF